jgi:hypothetical protein
MAQADKEGRWVAVRESVGLDLLLAAPDYHEAAQLVVESAGPLDAEDLSKGIVVSEEAFDALRSALQKAKP